MLANFVVYKAILKSANNYALQWVNGFSGFQAVEGVMHIAFNTLMTIFFNFMVCVYDQDVSRIKYGTIEKEKDLSVSMAEHFKYRRVECDRKRFIFKMLIWDVYALACGFGIFLIFYFSQGIMNAKGHMYDVATYGVVSTVCVVYLHHVQVFVHVRNWTFWMLMWFCISMVFLPISCFIAQMPKYTQMKGAIFSQLLPSMQLNVTILLIVGCFSAPIIFERRLHTLVFYPKYYT